MVTESDIVQGIDEIIKDLDTLRVQMLDYLDSLHPKPEEVSREKWD